MHLHTPALVLVPDTFLSAKDASLLTSGSRAANTSLLVELIRDEFPGAHIEPIGRKYWNETAGMSWPHIFNSDLIISWSGMEFVQQLCVQDEERAGLILAVVNKCAYIHTYPLVTNIYLDIMHYQLYLLYTSMLR